MLDILHTTLGDYFIEKQLGTGSFATVYLCRSKTNQYAIKLVTKQNQESYQLLFNGHQILKNIHGNDTLEDGKEYIVQFVDVVNTDDYFGVVLELIPGVELFDYVISNHRVVDGVALGLEESVAKVIMKQLLKAVRFIHEKGIVHGDIKLENVMVVTKDTGPFIKLIDFGLAHYVKDNTKLKGTEAYQAPEIIMNLDDPDYYKSDIWACGIIMFALLTSRMPFDREQELEAIASSAQGRRSMLRRIAIGSYQFRPVEQDNLSTESMDMLKSMLARNQDYRKHASELLEHSWFNT